MFADQRSYDTASYAEYLDARNARAAHKAQKGKSEATRPVAPPHQDAPVPQARAPILNEGVSKSTAVRPPSASLFHQRPNTSARRRAVTAKPQRQKRGSPKTTRHTTAADSTSATVEDGSRMISPPPLRSPRVTASHGPPATADRQIVTELPRSPGKECAERRMSDSQEGESSDGPECDSCGRDLSERASHRCQECLTLVCSPCLVNAAVFHPGHTLQPATAQEQLGQPRRGGTAQELARHQEQSTPAGNQAGRPRPEGFRPGGDGKHDEVTGRGAQYRCYFCEKPLLDTRYECQTCSDGLNLCEGCLDVHPRAHLLELFNCGPERVRRPPAAEQPRRAPATSSHRCFFCEELLQGVGYECQTCSLHLCHGHRDLHPAAHQLRAITQRAGPAAGGQRGRSPGRGDGTVLRGTEGETEGEPAGAADRSDGANWIMDGEVATGHDINRGTRRDSDVVMSDGDGDESPPPPSPSFPSPSFPTSMPRRSPRLSQPPRNDHSPSRGPRLDHTRMDHHARLSLAPRDKGKGVQRTRAAGPAVGATRQSSSLVTVTGSTESLLQFARAIFRAAGQQAAITDETGRDDNHGHDEEGDDDQPIKDLLDFDLSAEPPAGRGHKGHRRWWPEDRQRLSSLKQQGWDDSEIAAALQRSQGAVAQQWRKQRQ